MSYPRGSRTPKPPTRRELAATLAQAVPAVNAHSKNLHILKAELDAQRARLDQLQAAQQAWQAQGVVNRLLWLVRGVPA